MEWEKWGGVASGESRLVKQITPRGDKNFRGWFYPKDRASFTTDPRMNPTDARFDFESKEIKKELTDTADFGFLLTLATWLVL
jgi:hypothetical protein